MSPHGAVHSARGSTNYTLEALGVPSLLRAHKVVNPAASDQDTIVTGTKLALVFIAMRVLLFHALIHVLTFP
jgi:hypothetical protein